MSNIWIQGIDIWAELGQARWFSPNRVKRTRITSKTSKIVRQEVVDAMSDFGAQMTQITGY